MTIDDVPDLSGIDFGHPFATFVAEHMVFVKTNTAMRAGADDGLGNLSPAVAVFRGGEFITWIISDECNRDKGLEAAHGAIMGFAADEIVLGLDARMMVTGTMEEMEAIRPGDLQRMAEQEGSDIFGVTVECIVIQRMKDGWVQMATLPYTTRLDDDGQTRHIEWLEAKFESHQSDEKDALPAGYVPETVQEFFTQARDIPNLAALGTDIMGMSEAESRMHVDCAIIKILMDKGFAVLYNADTEEKREILQRSTESGVLEGMGMEFAGGGNVDDDGNYTPGTPE